MNLIQFDSSEGFHVRTAIIDELTVFVGKDVCECVGISKYRDALAKLDSDERVSVFVDTLGGRQEMVCVTESGLYALIFMSRKPEAKKFRKWVTAEVLPAIRQYGFYSIFPNADDALRQKLNARISGQMSHIRQSVENLAEPLPEGYGTISAFLASFGLDLSDDPAARLRLSASVRSAAMKRSIRIIPQWKPEGWRAVNNYPRELVREVLASALPDRTPQADLFE